MKYQGGIRLPDETIANLMIALIMAGHHSATTTVAWGILFLVVKPNLWEELNQEQAVERSSNESPLSLEDIERLTKLKNVIKETHRVHPPLHSLLRIAMRPIYLGEAGGVKVTVPKGRVLLMSPAHHSKTSRLFESPETWDPTHWEDSSMQAEVDKVFYPFGAGKHHCMG